jgi:hypothetical protein
MELRHQFGRKISKGASNRRAKKRASKKQPVHPRHLKSQSKPPRPTSSAPPLLRCDASWPAHRAPPLARTPIKPCSDRTPPRTHQARRSRVSELTHLELEELVKSRPPPTPTLTEPEASRHQEPHGEVEVRVKMRPGSRLTWVCLDGEEGGVRCGWGGGGGGASKAADGRKRPARHRPRAS